MTEDGVAPGEEPDDSPWRPDSAVTFDHPPRRSFVARRTSRGDRTAESSPERPLQTDEFSPRSRPLALIGLGLMAALILVISVGGAVLFERDGAGAPSGAMGVSASGPVEAADEPSVAARDRGGDVILAPGDTTLVTATECFSQRLPPTIEPLWDVALPEAHRVLSPVVIGDDSVVALVDLDPEAATDVPSASIVAIEADDGQERWRADLRSSTGRHEIVGIVDRVVIVRSAASQESPRERLFGFDEETGVMLWERGFRGDWSAAADAATGLVFVSVRRPAVSKSEDSEIEVLDARDGDRVHIAAGSLVSQVPDGRLVTRLGDKVLATSPTERDLLGVVVPSESPFVALGTDVLVANGNGPELSLFSGSDDQRAVPLVGSSAIDPPGFVVALEPLGRSSLIVTGSGAVHGAEVVDDAVEIRWRVSGIVVESAPTDRGRSLLVATEGGAQQRVIDSSTGRSIVDVDLRPGSFATLALVSNGAIVQDSVDGEEFRVAFDLDGRELWSLAGSGALAIGRGLVVTVEDVDQTIRLAAAGVPLGTPNGPTECQDDAAGGDEAEPVLLGAAVTDR